MRWNTIGVARIGLQNRDAPGRQSRSTAMQCELFYAGYMNLSGGMPVSLMMAGVPTEFPPNPYPYNMEEAQRLIEQAGAKGATVSIMSPQGRWPRDTELLDYIANQLRQAGLNVEVNIVEYGIWNAEVNNFREGDQTSDAILNFSGNEIPMLWRRQTATWLARGTRTFPVPALSASHPEADALIAQAMSEFDVDKRNELSRK